LLPGWEGPGAAAEEFEHRGHEDAADDDRVEEDGGCHRDAEQLDHAVVAEGEGDEDCDHDRGGGGDHASGVGESLAHLVKGRVEATPFC
jgi:hypothetical protein